MDWLAMLCLVPPIGSVRRTAAVARSALWAWPTRAAAGSPARAGPSFTTARCRASGRKPRMLGPAFVDHVIGDGRALHLVRDHHPCAQIQQDT
jgi:hypothetical protein